MSASSKPASKHGIELGQDMEFQRRSWTAQRFAWMLLALCIAAAFVGLWGSSPMSQRIASATDGSFHIEYQRFARFKAPTQLSLHFKPQAVRAGEVRLWVATSYLERFVPRQIVPAPRSAEAGEQRVVFVFAAEPGRGGTVIFDMQPQGMGSVAAQAGVGEATLGFRQFVYP
jgi:hypothetical protein